MVASSTSIIGILSRTGYTRRHAVHFRLLPSSFWTNGFLQTGHTRISINSLSIIGKLYASCLNTGPQFPEPRLTSSPPTEYIFLPSILALSQFLVRAPSSCDEIGKRVQIPRCRATVSVEIYDRPLKGTSGRPVVEARTPNAGSFPEQRPYSQSQETGANRHHKPLSRVKGGVHAVLSTIRLLFYSLSSSFGC